MPASQPGATAATDAAPEDAEPTPEERAEPVEPVPAVPIPEDRIDPPAPPPAASPPVRTLAQVKSAIAAGRTDEAIAGLLALRRERPRQAYLWYLLGSLYFDKHYWSDGLETYRAAIHLSGGYRKRAVLIRNAIRALGSDKTHVRAAALLRQEIGAAATPYLKQAARADADPKVRARAQRLLKPTAPPRAAPARKAAPAKAAPMAAKRAKPKR
jgi:hypothetical protein